MIQLGGSTFLPGIKERSLTDLFLRGLTNNKKHNNSNEDLTNFAIDAQLYAIGEKIKKGHSLSTSLGIRLTNDEIKDIIKINRSLENRGILLKENNKKITSQEGVNFFKPLMATALPLMKNVLTPIAKSVLVPLR